MGRYVLTSARLGFREFVHEDFHELAKLFADPEVMKYYPSVYSKQKTAQWLRGTFEKYQRDGHGIWAAELLSTQRFIGAMGPANQDLEGRWHTEIGYLLKQEFWGQGFASEGALAVRDFAFGNLKKSELISLIYPKNQNSIKVALNLGMQKSKTIGFNGRVHDLFVVKNNSQRYVSAS